MRALLYVIFALIISGCAYTSSHKLKLDEAQRLMSENPKEAFDRLNAMDISEFDDSALVARWAVLYSESMVANRFHAPSDSILNIAVDYYSRHDVTQLQRLRELKQRMDMLACEDSLVTALYFQKEKEFRLYQGRVKHERNLLIGVIVLLLAIGIIIWQRQRIRWQVADNERLVAEASLLRGQIAAKDKDRDDLDAVLRSMLDARFALIDSLCQTYYESQGTKTERKAIAEKVRDEIYVIKADSLCEMEQAVNDCRHNLLVRLKGCLPHITPQDYQLAVYLACGLSARTICLLMGETVEVIYKRKSRLKARVRQSAPSADADILSIF